MEAVTGGEDSTVQPFFCIGSAKSGTTLLARVIDQHPKALCIAESYMLRPETDSCLLNLERKSWERHGLRKKDVRRWKKRARRFSWSPLEHLSYKFLKRRLLAPIAFKKNMAEMFEFYMKEYGLTHVGDKWPWYIDHIREMEAVFPHAKYIYNVRDPRGIWNSGEKFRGRRRGKAVMREMLRHEKVIAPYLERENFFTLRYEDLVSNPGKAVKTLFEFLGLDYDSDYLYYSEEDDPMPKRWDWVPEAKEQYNPGHADKWKKTLSDETIEKIEAESHGFMKKYGYSFGR